MHVWGIGWNTFPLILTCNQLYKFPLTCYLLYFSFTAFFACFSEASAQSVTSFHLVDAATDADLGPIPDGATIDLASYSTTTFNIRVSTNPFPVGSVVFDYNGTPAYATESSAPYALFGDNAGNYNAWTPSPGAYTLTATAFSGSGGAGSSGSPLSIAFSIINSVPGGGSPAVCGTAGNNAVQITGELKKWHKITFDFHGPASDESCVANPFLDYRLQVTFSNNGKNYVVPGYFAADGDAAESSATGGHIWRCHFAPDETGTWTYIASFREGSNLAIDPDPLAGTALAFDGSTGTFTVAPSDKTGRDLRAKGRLTYIGQRYLQFQETGEYFLKGGADAPENLLAYEDFDNTPNTGNRRKSWSPHAGDWQTGDPDWQGGKGRELIGAINYLAGKGMNVFSFLTMNIGGDDRNVFPYVTYNNQASPQDDRQRFDVSKLAQWEKVFEHADRLGLYLHFKTQETENDQLLDQGELGVERMLYYRELIARFGHHLALNWNLGEENDIWQEKGDPTQTRIKAYAAYIRALDPYDHHIVLHTYPGQQQAAYTPLVGENNALTGVSIQTGWNNVYQDTKYWVETAENSGMPWVVANDETGPANYGVPPDNGYNGFSLPAGAPSQDDIRQSVLWGNLMAGGGGVEYYFGYQLPHSDLSCEDFRSRDQIWDYTRYALDFFRNYVPFWEMAADNSWTNAGRGLRQTGDGVYVLYLPDGGTNIQVDLSPGSYEFRWFNPRTGGFSGITSSLNGGTGIALGSPPNSVNADWVALITAATTFPVELMAFTAEAAPQGVDLTWQTATEQNSDHFEIQRSIDGVIYQPLGAVASAGQSQTIQRYTFLDTSPPTGRLYYRLKMIDQDGSFVLSDVREVSLGTFFASADPNPVTDILTVRMFEPASSSMPVSIQLIGMDGRMLQQHILSGSGGASATILDMNSYPPGLYMIQVIRGRESVLSKRLLKIP